MEFHEAIEVIGTVSGDVKGKEKRLGTSIVRRKLPAGYTIDASDEDEDDDEKDLDELMVQLSGDQQYMAMTKHWKKGDNEKRLKGSTEPDEDDEDDEAEDES